MVGLQYWKKSKESASSYSEEEPLLGEVLLCSWGSRGTVTAVSLRGASSSSGMSLNLTQYNAFLEEKDLSLMPSRGRLNFWRFLPHCEDSLKGRRQGAGAEPPDTLTHVCMAQLTLEHGVLARRHRYTLQLCDNPHALCGGRGSYMQLAF
ncbi:hypothetical protein EYF80_000643 [Liparis tanakae]|uniref:Uncharacterized protein n=1 Tax=Liparis tanakae TaxID=230148 RepID=A0A4Z2JGH4_9TELE|nr:hypothetical protein EYF80_000643 [Liparis tanakae]